jgi:hypothetical protein
MISLGPLAITGTVLGFPLIIYGFWRGVVGTVHLSDTLTEGVRLLRKETVTNGATSAASKASHVLPSYTEPSIKDMLGAVIVALTLMQQTQQQNDTKSTARLDTLINKLDGLTTAISKQNSKES